MSIPASGQQFEIVRGNQRAVVTEVGSTLRLYQVAGRDVITSFDSDAIPNGCQGQHLLPWPNRIKDGRYVFDGVSHQLPINEPERNNALHGLASWIRWDVAELATSHVTLRTVVHAQPGFLATLSASITHWLTDDGLVVDVAATNIGNTSAPFGYAAHPYLVCDDLTQARLDVPFASYLSVDDRLLPIEHMQVAGSAADVSDGPLGGIELDTAYSQPRRVDDRWQIRLTTQTNKTTVWGDSALGWAQIYTPPGRRSIAVEPSSCGPNAYNDGPTHADLTVLAPGATFRATWGINPG